MKKKTCPLCNKRAEDAMCGHTRLARHGYWTPDGKFYLSDTMGMRMTASKLKVDPEPFIKKTL
jgi:hypothetical protein